MNTKHTPGPWELGIALSSAQIAVIGDGDSVVALLPDPSVGMTFKRADADLIAAAPELLAAVDELLLEAGNLRGELIPCDTLARARAAIAKATGETP